MSVWPLGFPSVTSGKNKIKNPPAGAGNIRDASLGMEPTPVFSPGESHGQRSLAGYSPWGRRESDMIE